MGEGIWEADPATGVGNDSGDALQVYAELAASGACAGEEEESEDEESAGACEDAGCEIARRASETEGTAEHAGTEGAADHAAARAA